MIYCAFSNTANAGLREGERLQDKEDTLVNPVIRPPQDLKPLYQLLRLLLMMSEIRPMEQP